MLGGLTSRFRVVTGIVGALVLLLGLLFIGAATAFAGHGPGMRVTVVPCGSVSAATWSAARRPSSLHSFRVATGRRAADRAQSRVIGRSGCRQRLPLALCPA
jgi:hypothetical protein